MTEILFGGRDGDRGGRPATISLINCNSPLRWDDRMLDAQFEYCAASQPVVLTPFLLMGAMSPVTIPAALAQQMAEALTGIALAQLIRPGCPVIFGSFLSNIDMQSGSPSLRHPGVGHRAAVHRPDRPALRAAVPHRRRAELVSQTADAQAAYEALMTHAADVPGSSTNFVMHAAGWLEGGLVSLLREVHHRRRDAAQMLQVEFTPLEIDEAVAGLRRARGGRPRRPLPRRASTRMERFRECFYRPLLSSTANFERWLRSGGA